MNNFQTWKEQNNYCGFDWSELCRTFNVPLERIDIEESEEFDCMIKSLWIPAYYESHYLKVFLQAVIGEERSKNSNKNNSKVFEYVCRECRKFVKRLAIRSDVVGESEFWKGLSKVKCDLTFISLLAETIHLAWN